MKIYILVSCLIHWTFILGEYWRAKVQNRIRCTSVFNSSTTETELKCLRDCFKTLRCCSVNYVEELNLCEFCTPGPTVRLVRNASYRYIGYTTNQDERDFADHINHVPCYACAEYFDSMEVTTVNTTDNDKIKNFKCNNNTEFEEGITEASCEYKTNKWSTSEFVCRKTCYETKEEFNEPVSTLTNGGKCLRWDDPAAELNYFPDSYFTADGNSKTAAHNYCRHPTLEGSAKYYRSATYLFCNHEDPLIGRAMCAVRSCYSTDLDQCGPPPSLPSPAEVSFPVVGDVFLANYKCSKFSGDDANPNCPVSRCIGTYNWTIPSISCSSKDCYPTGSHASYAGKRSCTESGRTCQDWDSNYPHFSEYKGVFGNDSSNFCRGIRSRRPWCYTMDPEVRWETCNVPEC